MPPGFSRSSTALAFAGGLTLACHAEPPGKYPPRAEGCEVRVFPDEPSYQTDNIGPVQSACDETISDADCLRTLKDEACKLGADTVWGVSDPPRHDQGKKRYAGRAAHQK